MDGDILAPAGPRTAVRVPNSRVFRVNGGGSSAVGPPAWRASTQSPRRSRIRVASAPPQPPGGTPVRLLETPPQPSGGVPEPSVVARPLAVGLDSVRLEEGILESRPVVPLGGPMSPRGCPPTGRRHRAHRGRRGRSSAPRRRAACWARSVRRGRRRADRRPAAPSAAPGRPTSPTSARRPAPAAPRRPSRTGTRPPAARRAAPEAPLRSPAPPARGRPATGCRRRRARAAPR